MAPCWIRYSERRSRDKKIMGGEGLYGYYMEVCDFIQMILYLHYAYYACICMYRPIWFYFDFIHHGFYMKFIHHGFNMDFIHHRQWGLYTSPDVNLSYVVFNSVFYCFINLSAFVSNDENKDIYSTRDFTFWSHAAYVAWVFSSNIFHFRFVRIENNFAP